MRNPKLVQQKAKRNLALNLSELAVVSGYPRGALARMYLPLQFGKISLNDFWRILQRRQDQAEARIAPICLTGDFASKTSREEIEGVDRGSIQALADKFCTPSPKGRAAS